MSDSPPRQQLEPEFEPKLELIPVYPITLPGSARQHLAVETLLKLVPIALVLAAMPLMMRSVSGERWLLAVTIFIALYASRAYGTSVLLAVVFLAFLGGLRRWLILYQGWPPNDPLVLVCPIVVGLSFLQKAFQRQIPHDTRASRLIFWLLLFMVAQIFNPMQGGIQVGLAGAIFYIVPLLWYYFGRELGTPALMSRLYGFIVGIAILAAAYGLYQTFFGFTDYEKKWIDIAGYTALNAGGGQIRAISFFTSASEYDWFMVIAVVILWAQWLRGNFLALLPIPLLIAAIFLETGRGPLVVSVFTCMILWAVLGKNRLTWAPRIAAAIVIGAFGLVWSVRQVQEVAPSARTSRLVAHQTEGILDPLNEKKSTVGVHAGMLSGGLLTGLTNPVGRGLGSTTIAASKFGGEGAGTEVDYSDMLVSLGTFGGLLYFGVIWTVIAQAFRCWHRDRSSFALAACGIIIALFGHWIHGGQYSVSMIVCFTIGALDRAWKEGEKGSEANGISIGNSKERRS